MKFDVESISTVKKKINIVFPGEKVGEKIDKAYNRLRKTVKIDGFRPGKAPRSLLEKRYKDRVLGEVLDDILKESYPEIIAKEGLEPVAYPDFGGEEIQEGEDFAFSLSVDVRPDIEPRDYEGIALNKEDTAISDEDVAGELEKLQKNFAAFSDVEGRGIEKGDVVTFDFEGFIDGEPIENGKAENSNLEIGSGQFIPGFEEGMVGMGKGESGDVKAAFPDDYHAKELAGKEALFKVTIKEVKKAELPDLDDEFAKDVGDYDSLDALKERISTDLKAAREEESKRKLHKDLVDAIIKENAIEVPESMVKRQAQYKADETRKQMTSYGMPKEEIERNISSMADAIMGDAERQVKSGLLLEAIAEKEGIAVEEEDIDKYFAAMAEKSGRPLDEIRKYFGDKRDYVTTTVLDNKILDYLLEKAKIS
ncbi:MAG: trigger factor [Deltaproteobacteria bacterium]|nr:trigger factor [Deltaproteobacteria bacterium]